MSAGRCFAVSCHMLAPMSCYAWRSSSNIRWTQAARLAACGSACERGSPCGPWRCMSCAPDRSIRRLYRVRVLTLSPQPSPPPPSPPLHHRSLRRVRRLVLLQSSPPPPPLPSAAFLAASAGPSAPYPPPSPPLPPHPPPLPPPPSRLPPSLHAFAATSVTRQPFAKTSFCVGWAPRKRRIGREVARTRPATAGGRALSTHSARRGRRACCALGGRASARWRRRLRRTPVPALRRAAGLRARPPAGPFARARAAARGPRRGGRAQGAPHAGPGEAEGQGRGSGAGAAPGRGRPAQVLGQGQGAGTPAVRRERRWSSVGRPSVPRVRRSSSVASRSAATEGEMTDAAPTSGASGGGGQIPLSRTCR